MERIFTLDLHSHLHEKKIKPREWWNAAVTAKLDAIAITEHPEFNPKDAYDVLNSMKPDGIVLIPGAELDSAVGHVLVYGKTPEFYEISELFQEDIPLDRILEIGNQNNLLVSCSHPWGFDLDSIGFYYDLSDLEKLVRKKTFGIEAYNGLVGTAAMVATDSPWVLKTLGFFRAIEKSKIASKLKLDTLSRKLEKKLDHKAQEMVRRSANALELGRQAAFVTAGSDAHSADRVGTGVLKIKADVEQLTNENVLDLIRQKHNVIWSGPAFREIEPGVYEKVKIPVRKKELAQGVSYTLKRLWREKKKERKKQTKLAEQRLVNS